MRITVRSDANIPLSWASGTDRIARNVLNVIRTWQGEAAFVRPMGIEAAFVGMPATMVAPSLSAAIRANIEQYEPEANILSVRAIPDERGAAIIEVSVEVADNV